MSVSEILHQIEALPSQEKWQVLELTRSLLEPEIPREFMDAMAEIERGDVEDLDVALKDLDRLA